MFTGIITDLGRVREVRRPPAGAGDTRLVVETAYDTGSMAIGASVACSGCCLTVVDKGPGWFAADVSAESLARTTLATWTAGTPVNLERSLRLGNEMGGHLVYGHVDGVGCIVELADDGDSRHFVFEAPDGLAHMIAPKGSIALDGVSLTVNEVGKGRFGVNIVPHTAAVTTFGGRRPGEPVNVEIDMLARYVARLSEALWTSQSK